MKLSGTFVLISLPSLGFGLILMDLQAAGAPAISSMFHTIEWRKEEKKNEYPSLLMKHYQVDHTLICLYWN